ncbi:MAG TPA: DUF4173 domain-containing protein [Allosphingosinicella sp.]|nr:DUF4173 domain-containing protein [Allosphingosinicella sp.]
MEIAAPAFPAVRLGRRYSFAQKLILGTLLVTLADHLFFFQRLGATLGIFAAALTGAILVATPAIGRSRDGLVAAALALLYALLLADDPSVLALALFALAATLAALLPRTRGFDDGWRWAKRLLLHAFFSALAPFMDWARLRQARRRRGPARLGRLIPVLILPIVGSLVFLALFSAANPLIESAFSRIDLAILLGRFSVVRLLFWFVMVLAVWSLLRPAHALIAPRRFRTPAPALPGAGATSIALSLLAFNAVFALQNGLDIAFLWSGAPLPAGMTLAEYAHRGAYPLIATALLAALFVLVALRPGSETARSAPIRRLVYLWIGQNIFLVASTMLRTADYVEAYSLTRLRIAALAWMALVAVGLALICVRIWREKSGAWLINANLAAALLVLTAGSTVDLGAVAAAWNVRHAREAGGRGAGLDYCYLWILRSSALLPLVELESRPLPPPVRARLSWLRNVAMDRLETSQGDWHGWTFRGARRLREANRLVAARRLPRVHGDLRPCGFDTAPRGM